MTSLHPMYIKYKCETGLTDWAGFNVPLNTL